MDDKPISQEVELEACAKDFIYFCTNYVKIVHPKKGLIPLELYEYQKRLIKTAEDNRFVIGNRKKNTSLKSMNSRQ